MFIKWNYVMMKKYWDLFCNKGGGDFDKFYWDVKEKVMTAFMMEKKRN